MTWRAKCFRNCQITLDVVTGKSAMTELALKHGVSTQRISQIVNETLMKAGMVGIPHHELNVSELGYRLRQQGGLITEMFDVDTPAGFYYNELYGKKQ